MKPHVTFDFVKKSASSGCGSDLICSCIIRSNGSRRVYSVKYQYLAEIFFAYSFTLFEKSRPIGQWPLGGRESQQEVHRACSNSQERLLNNKAQALLESTKAQIPLHLLKLVQHTCNYVRSRRLTTFELRLPGNFKISR